MGYKKEIHILLGNWNTNKQLSLLNKARVIHGPHDPPLWEEKKLGRPKSNIWALQFTYVPLHFMGP